MAIQKSSGLMTFAGILGAFSASMVGIPAAALAYYAQVAKTGPPEWFNPCIFPMILFGVIGGALAVAIMGVVGKGQDDTPTVPQVAAATQKAAAENAVAQAADPAKDPKLGGQ